MTTTETSPTSKDLTALEQELQMRGINVALYRQLENLRYADLGRPVGIKKLTDTDDYFYLGQCLPANGDGSVCVMILGDGTQVVFEKRQGMQPDVEERYSNVFTSGGLSNEPIIISGAQKDLNIMAAVGSLSDFIPSRGGVISAISTNPDDAGCIDDAVRKSMGIAEEVRNTRVQAKNARASATIVHISGLFGTSQAT